MDQLESKIILLEQKMDSLQKSIDRLKNILFWILIISVVLFVLPLIGLIFVVPKFLSIYGGLLN